MPRMHSHRPILSQHRLRRLVLWALAMLRWLRAVLFSDQPLVWRHLRRFEEASLGGLAHLTRHLLIVRALDLAGPPPLRRTFSFWRRGRDMRRAHFWRSALGAKLRRALRSRDPATHMTRLIDVLSNLDTYAVQLARRFRSGLPRLSRTAAPVAPDAMLGALFAYAPDAADSS